VARPWQKSDHRGMICPGSVRSLRRMIAYWGRGSARFAGQFCQFIFPPSSKYVTQARSRARTRPSTSALYAVRSKRQGEGVKIARMQDVHWNRLSIQRHYCMDIFVRQARSTGSCVFLSMCHLYISSYTSKRELRTPWGSYLPL
jgi:hypothetical protein